MLSSACGYCWGRNIVNTVYPILRAGTLPLTMIHFPLRVALYRDMTRLLPRLPSGPVLCIERPRRVHLNQKCHNPDHSKNCGTSDSLSRPLPLLPAFERSSRYAQGLTRAILFCSVRLTGGGETAAVKLVSIRMRRQIRHLR
jgi:hypothetical protein